MRPAISFFVHPHEEVNINGRTIRDFRYADDTTLLSKTEEGLRNLVEVVEDHSEAKDLMLNNKKTNIMDTDKCTLKANIQLNGQPLENVEYFEYLVERVENYGGNGWAHSNSLTKIKIN